MGAVQRGQLQIEKQWVWFHGFGYNATLGSRTALTGASNVLKNGMPLCYDVEAVTDLAAGGTLPTGMSLKGVGAHKPFVNVTKPVTSMLGSFAGIVCDLENDLDPDKGGTFGYKGGRWICIQTRGPVEAYVLGDVTAYTDRLVPVNGQWYLSPAAIGTNGVNIPNYVAAPGYLENVAAAALRNVKLLGFVS